MGKNPIEQTSQFREGMNLLTASEREDVFLILEMYMVAPFHPSLRNHSLREEDSRVRSISVNDDLRVIFRDRGEGKILLVDVGNHERVY